MLVLASFTVWLLPMQLCVILLSGLAVQSPRVQHLLISLALAYLIICSTTPGVPIPLGAA